MTGIDYERLRRPVLRPDEKPIGLPSRKEARWLKNRQLELKRQALERRARQELAQRTAPGQRRGGTIRPES
jgi:hypothetical protein